MLKRWLLALPHRYKTLLQIGTDVILVWLALWFSFVIRLGGGASFNVLRDNSWLLWAAPLTAIPVFIPFGMYRSVIRYFDKQALLTILKAVSVSALLLVLLIYWHGATNENSIPRSYVLIYWLLILLFSGGIRLFMRYYFAGGLLVVGKSLMPFARYNPHASKVAIYGAGDAGNQLLVALRMGNDLHPVAFIDDNISFYRRRIAGLKVYDPSHIAKMIKETGVTEILLAIPSATRARRREILSNLETHALRVRTVPGLMDLVSGRVRVQDVQDVDAADLLGRDVVKPYRQLFDRCIKGRVVMVTGSGGSIGSELCRQILTSGATILILYDHSEFGLYNIHKELKQNAKYKDSAAELVPILGSIRNFKRMREVMQSWNVDSVYHAAAYKHVPMVEYNTVEGILNNVLGTLRTAQAAIVAGVENFVLISTDKAVRPTNVMGASKRLAEMVLQALSKEKEIVLFGRKNDGTFANRTRFTMVRFGNVLGSSGSVIPLFREQIRNGGPVTVTHPEITRFFMTIPEAAQLVIQAGSMGKGGDVFVLDMGEPVRILDLAKRMIALMGLTVRSDIEPMGDITIDFTGLRPGEKLYEELLIGENEYATEHPKIKCSNEIMLPWGELEKVLERLVDLVAVEDCGAIRGVLTRVVNGYHPQGEIVDWVYNQKSMENRLCS